MKLWGILLATAMLLTARMADAQPLVRMFKVQIDPAQSLAFDTAGRQNMRASNREESGVLAMHAVASRDKPGTAYVFDIYADDDAYRHHIGSRHYKDFVETTRPLVTDKQLMETYPIFLAEKPIPLSVMRGGKAPDVRIVEVTVKREDIAEFRRIVVAEMRESMKVEPGVLAMYAVARKERPEQWIFFEIYADAAAYASHRETPHFQEYLSLTDDMLIDKGHIGVENIALQSRGGLLFDALPITAATRAKPAPAYYVAEFEATGVGGIKPYSAQVADTFEPYGGRFIVRGAVPDVKEGFGAQGRLVVIKFDSLAQAQAWYDSPAYQAIIPIRHRSGNSRTYIVTGLPEP